MAKRYRRKRNRRETTVFEDVVGMGSLLVLLSTIKVSKDAIDKYRDAAPVLIVTAIALVGLIIFVGMKRRTKARDVFKAYKISNVDDMSGLEFEVYLADLLRRRGFSNVSLTEQYDFGVDIIAQKDGVTWGIQAKRYKSLVRAEAVRQVYTALVRYKCDKAMVITNSFYSRPARELARDNRIELVDRRILEQWIYEGSKTIIENHQI